MLAITWEEPLALRKALKISSAAGRLSDGLLSAMELYVLERYLVIPSYSS